MSVIVDAGQAAEVVSVRTLTEGAGLMVEAIVRPESAVALVVPGTDGAILGRPRMRGVMTPADARHLAMCLNLCADAAEGKPLSDQSRWVCP